MQQVEKTTTGLIIHQPSDEVKRAALRYFSLKDPVREYFIYVGKDISKKPIFGKEHDVLYITSGFLTMKDQNVIPLKKFIKTIPPREGATIEIKMNREPRSQLQRDCIDAMVKCKSPKLTIEVKPGVGKEQPYSTLIPTPNGYVKMGDLNIGDTVFSRDGMMTHVTGIFEQGVKNVYKITFQDGRTAMCGLEHLWTIKTDDSNEWTTVTTETLIKNIAHKKIYIPTCDPVNFPHTNVPIDPYVLGCLIGNGCLRDRCLAISSGDEYVPNKIAEICGFGVRRRSLHNYTYDFYDKKTLKPIDKKQFFKDLPEFIDSYSYEKRIPHMYLINSVDVRLKLLQGLMDTDGSISSKGYYVSYCSTSLNLLNDLQQLLYSFGYSSRLAIDKRVEKYTSGFCANLYFRIPNSIKNLIMTHPRKLLIANEAVNDTKSSSRHDYSKLRITNIELSHREQCRCIMVDNPEHLYLTEDYIVTHNTFMALYAVYLLKKKPIIIAPTANLKNQWIENFTDLGIDEDDIATRIYDAPDKKLCVVTISSIENALRDDWKGLMDVMDKANFGIRIVDEAHLHLKGLLKFDAICNIKHNYYLSATLGRSDEVEDRVLNRALSDAERFVGSKKYEEYQTEYIIPYLQDIYYNASSQLCQKHFKYGKKGLISATYYRMLMDYRNGKPFVANVIHMVKVAQKIKEQGKVLLLLPLLDAIAMVEEEMKKQEYFKEYTIAHVDGSMPIAERQKAFESDIILSTTMSCGTGVDISNLGAVVNFDQKSSPIIFEQIVGRLRDRGFQCYYFDICDHVKYARAFEKWGMKRRVVLKSFPGVSGHYKQLPAIYC